ncbi:MAG: hypothetical protein JXA99_16085 [Candidatus Lokiarchaeota archaeon]|nr:hypothetical protein [Candidatus Lokiarchaeota archaeon]
MIQNHNYDFQNLLHIISSPLTLKILKLYKNNSYNLTETSKLIDEAISTVQDNLNKLKKINLIKKENKYFSLTNLGSYILNSLNRFEILSNFNNIFGKINSESIPSKLLYDYLPYFQNINTNQSSFDFIANINNIFKKIKDTSKNSTFQLGLIGWWDFNFEYKLFKMFYDDFDFLDGDIPNELKNFKLQIVTDKTILQFFKGNNKILDLFENQYNIKEKIRIYDRNFFQFTILKINEILIFSLIKDGDIDYHNYFIINDQPKLQEFFDSLYKYYYNLSKPLNDFL